MPIENYSVSFLLFCKNNNYVPSNPMYHAWNHASIHRPAVIDEEMKRGHALADLLRRRRLIGPPEPPQSNILRGPVTWQGTSP